MTIKDYQQQSKLFWHTEKGVYSFFLTDSESIERLNFKELIFQIREQD